MILEKALEWSDDFSDHTEGFIEAAKILIQSGHLTKEDFYQNGGWLKSVDFHASYFVYSAKNLHISARYYFDTVKEEIFQYNGKMDKIILYRRKNGPRNAPYVAITN